MERASDSLKPQEFVLVTAVMIAALMAGLLLSIHGAQAAPPQPGDASALPAGTSPETVLGRAYLDLGALTLVDNIDESDNVRWSLVRGTPAGDRVGPASNGVDWSALREATTEGAFTLSPGASWSFNASFGGGAGYKLASGVLAGGQCALATAFRAAALQAGLPAQSIPHQYPVPGFTHSQTVTIWWGTYDLTIENPTSQALSLAWKLTPAGVEVRVVG